MAGHLQRILDEVADHNAPPFPAEEFQTRLSRIRHKMAHEKIDLLFVSSPESLFYISGFQCEWYQAQSGRAFPPCSGIAIHVDHDRFIHFETPSERVLTHLDTISQDIRIFPGDSRRNGLSFIMSELQAAGWLTGRVGLELYNYRPNPVVSKQYVSAFEGAGMEVCDTTDLLRGVRHQKSPLEMECIRDASRIADIGMLAARDAIAPGVSELEVFGEMVAAMTRAGGEFSAILPPVASGFRANTSHPIATHRIIQRGERVNVDISGVSKRYHSNLARGFYVGEPPVEVEQFHNRIVAVFDEISSMIKPRLKVHDLLDRVHDFYSEIGVLEDAYWIGGYELGIAFPPDWVGPYIYDKGIAEDDDVFLPDTVVNHEAVFFGPEASGLSVTIDTITFESTTAMIESKLPRELCILHT